MQERKAKYLSLGCHEVEVSSSISWKYSSLELMLGVVYSTSVNVVSYIPPLVVFTVFSLTDVVIYVDQLIQEVFDGGHTAEDDGMKRRHPLLLPVTQLKAQVPDTL